MKLLLFFDLPTQTKAQRKEYQKFHQFLMKNGYIMMQYSVYYKTCVDNTKITSSLNMIGHNLPTAGKLRTMNITEMQFNSIKNWYGSSEKETKQFLIF